MNDRRGSGPPHGAEAAKVIQKQLTATNDGLGFPPGDVWCRARDETHVWCDQDANAVLQSEHYEFELRDGRWQKVSAQAGHETFDFSGS